MTLPSLGSGRAILFFGALTLLAGLAMLPALHTLSDSGTGIWAIEHAGSASEAKGIHDGLSEDSRQAAYVQLFIDLPFLIGYGGLIASICLWTADLMERAGRVTAAGLLTLVAWFGPVAALLDLLQNVALAFVLGGHTRQPWPRISDLAGYATLLLALSALAVAVVMLLAWTGDWRRPPGRKAEEGQ